MDRAIVKKHLEQALEHVALGGQHIARQREIVAELTNRGTDVTEAIRLLTNFEESQVMHVAHLERLKEELRECDEKHQAGRSRLAL
ncbi:hypothetical protein GGE45_001389 [Rhizobium aethiopicum]|uniref:Uncharacterized protein n=1 Tax=Rhizobium aethiopicum TaxID=1138170 RepID=A0A7W6Q9L9_9HYPH|nr:hypothetical protein [Rhizobium aethiopicum]MBB4191882.1 hypothetical protein [Rhizobium aethiopicum]MBB4579069.1 hypothetical protein [Rhizobium aethiopicum]